MDKKGVPKQHTCITCLKRAVFVIIVLLIVGFGLYSILHTSQTKRYGSSYNPSQGWKTYVNKKLGMQFDYPASLQLRESDDSVTIGYHLSYIFQVQKYATPDDFPTWWSKNSDRFIPFVVSKTTFQSKQAYQMKVNTNQVQAPMDLYAVPFDGYILLISYDVPFNLSLYSASEQEGYREANTIHDKEIKPMVDRILASFTFLK